MVKATPKVKEEMSNKRFRMFIGLVFDHVTNAFDRLYQFVFWRF